MIHIFATYLDALFKAYVGRLLVIPHCFFDSVVVVFTVSTGDIKSLISI